MKIRSGIDAALLPALLGIALLKAFFIVRDYMHLGRVFASDEESH